jgi:hypothetical protein
MYINNIHPLQAKHKSPANKGYTDPHKDRQVRILFSPQEEKDSKLLRKRRILFSPQED